MRDQTEQELRGPIGEVKRERKQMEVLKGVKTLPGTGSLEQVHPEVRWARAAAEGRLGVSIEVHRWAAPRQHQANLVKLGRL